MKKGGMSASTDRDIWRIEIFVTHSNTLYEMNTLQ